MQLAQKRSAMSKQHRRCQALEPSPNATKRRRVLNDEKTATASDYCSLLCDETLGDGVHTTSDNDDAEIVAELMDDSLIRSILSLGEDYDALLLSLTSASSDANGMPGYTD